ncbi:MAG: biopolymer transporter ExbD [Polyangia bacterium]
MAMSGPSNSGGGGLMAEINVTPMVDVMLVLLIIFMVAAPMLQTGVPVSLPKAEAQAIPDDSGKLIVTVPKEFVKDNKVYLVKTPFLLGPEFDNALKNNAKLQAEKEVYIHADQELPYGAVVKVMAALSRNGGEKIGLVTDPLQ